MDYTGLTLRIAADSMKGINRSTKKDRTAVCLGWVEGLGWAVVPTTSTWKAPWQRPIRQSGPGWRGWDLRYRASIHWTPNVVIYLSDEEIQAAWDRNPTIGWAPDDVVNHGIDELEHAIDHNLMGISAWFNQPGLSRD